MEPSLQPTPEERDRIVAEARRMRAEAIASLFRAAGRGIARLFGVPARALQRTGVEAGRAKPSSARV